MSPLVSVILPVHRYDRFLDEAILSILNQTYNNLELLIMVNGEEREEIYTHLITNFDDSRIRIMNTTIGQLPFVLNYGIEIANGQFIARMDADDISLPERIETQVSFLLENECYGFIGTAYALINEDGDILRKVNVNIDSDIIKKKLMVGNQFAHPTVMFRKKIITKCRGYAYGFFAEDYELFIRLMYEYNVRATNLDSVLLCYRLHDKQLTNMVQKKINNAYIYALSVLCIFKYKNIGFIFSSIWQLKITQSVYSSIKRIFK